LQKPKIVIGFGFLFCSVGDLITLSHEFELIDHYFKPLSQPIAQGDLGIGDDGALISVPDDNQSVIVTDTMVESVHYPAFTSPYAIGWKLLAVNLSDLAAMGAIPHCYSLAVSLPEATNDWLKAFTAGLGDLAGRYQIPLIGGDTTKSQQTVLTLSAMGRLPKGTAVCRSGAQVGDVVMMSGTLGDGGIGLKAVLTPEAVQFIDTDALEIAVAKLNQPEPRISLGEALREVANSAIDVSDGLLADLGHICQASNVSVELELSALPLSEAGRAWVAKKGYALPLTAGDDYELCFTVPKACVNAVQEAAKNLGTAVYVIGEVVSSAESKVILKQNGRAVAMEEVASQPGYRHF
jgi:thiamine-monophosphate kinase